MEFAHIIIWLIRRVDERRLRDVRFWIPDLDQVLRDPKQAFQNGEIEIGSWTHYLGITLVLFLFTFTAVAIVGMVKPIWMASVVVLAWLFLTKAVIASGRGGSCVLRGTGVEFRYQGVSAFCPWDVFHVNGQAIYYPDKYRLVIPVQASAIGRIELRKHDSIVAEGVESRGAHFQVLPTAEVQLKLIYGIQPLGLGVLLLTLGDRLGRTVETSTASVSLPAPAAVQADEKGWIRVNLTRLRFPRNCCNCANFTDRWEKFEGYSAFFSADMSRSVFVNAPLCVDCKRGQRRFYWWTLFKTALLIIICVTSIGFVVGLVLDFCGATPGRGAMTAMLTFFGLLISTCLSWHFAAKRARAVCAPLALAGYRSKEGTVQIRFRNAQYAELFLATMQAIY